MCIFIYIYVYVYVKKYTYIYVDTHALIQKKNNIYNQSLMFYNILCYGYTV